MDADDSLGLRSVSTEELRTLLKMVHTGQIACPVTPAQLAPLKFQHHTEAMMGILRGLDRSGCHAVLVAVLAERMA